MTIYFRGLVLCLIAVAIVGLLAIFRFFALRKRQEGLFELARRLNLSFNAGNDYGIPGRFNFLKQFEQGSNRYATNVLSGNYQQNDILVFDYHYETYSYDKSGRHTNDYWFSFCTLTLPAVFPDLTIRPENVLTRVAEAFGYQDIKFESAEFSKAFNVRSSDKKFAYDVCNAKMMEYLLANRDLNIEIENNVIALVFNRRIAVEQFEANLRRLVEIRSFLPEYLFTDTPQ